MNKKDKEKLQEQLIALFLYVMKYNKKLNPILIKYKVFKNELIKDINDIYNKYTRDNTFKMTSYQVNQEVKKLSDKISKKTNVLYELNKDILPVILYLVGKDVYSKTYSILYKDKTDLKNISKEELNNITTEYEINGKTIIDRLEDNKNIFNKRLIKNIKDSLENAKDKEETNKIVDETIESESKKNQRIVNNEIARVYTLETIEVYKEKGIKRVEWISQLEKNTCSQCSSLDGQVFDIDKCPIPTLDTHMNCHCILLPLD